MEDLGAEWLGSDEERGRESSEERRRVGEIQNLLDKQKKPSKSQKYDVKEAAFWLHRHVPPGSVIVYRFNEGELASAGYIAVLVKSVESSNQGLWLDIKLLGCSTTDFRSKLSAAFRGKNKKHHICYPDAAGNCPVAAEKGIHLNSFEWFPPGDFAAAWITATALKEVKKGPLLEQANAERKEKEKRDKKDAGDRSDIEKRLDRLRGRSPRVTFAGEEGTPPSGAPDASQLATRRAGALRRQESQPSQLALSNLPHARGIKDEVIDVEALPPSRTPDKPRAKGVAEVLAQAVATRRSRAVKEESKKKRRRSRSGSRHRSRRRHRSKPRSDSRSSSDRSSSARSSSASLQPPLKRKALKDPGSVYRLLVNQAAEQLAQEGLDVEAATSSEPGGRKVKLYSFYQLALKPSLDPRSRDCKEIALLARALDLLQDGELPQLADLLAARLIAVETATRQGWQAAKYLEIQSLEDDGTAPPHILLAAMKHSRQVQKAGGLGSWSRSQNWQWDWGGDQKGKGRGKDGKGKGKKGKTKGKGAKGNWSQWPQNEKEKTSEKGGKGDAS